MRRSVQILLLFVLVGWDVMSWSGRDGGPPLGAPPVVQGLVLAALCVGLPQTRPGRVAGFGIALVWLAMAAFDAGVLAGLPLLAFVAAFLFSPGYLFVVIGWTEMLMEPGRLLWGCLLGTAAMFAARGEKPWTWGALFAAAGLGVVRVDSAITWFWASI